MKPMKNPTHEEWLRKLIEEGFPSENVLLIGVRNSDKKEIDFMREKKIKQIRINSILEDIDNIADTIMEFCFGKEVYVSIDIDIVDPVFAPATGYQEVGGLTSRQFLYLIQRIRKIKNLLAVDIVEINSKKDKEFNMITTRLGAKILGELI
jgi:arginase family enzyme